MCEADRYDHVFKVVVAGDLAVGKSSLVARFTRNEFKVEVLGTVNVNLDIGYAEIDGKVIKAQIWDTCGHERFRSVILTYFRGAAGFLLVYDISKRSSYNSIRRWLKDIADHADPATVVMLVGNRSDLQDKRAVPTDEASRLAEQHGCLFAETSAFDATNVDVAFRSLLSGVLSKRVGTGDSRTSSEIAGARAGLVRSDSDSDS